MTTHEALRVLGFADDSSAQLPSYAVAKQRYHRLATERHPDHGGSAEEFARLHEAWKLLLPELERCHVCGGSGAMKIRRGWNEVSGICPHCGGLGKEPGA